MLKTLKVCEKGDAQRDTNTPEALLTCVELAACRGLRLNTTQCCANTGHCGSDIIQWYANVTCS